MDIGSLFLNLGVKGADKTVGAFTNIKKGLSETASMSLEAKAGILGAIYALERLFATSGKAGTNLANFNALTGESVKTLQQYQYAARQVGVSNEDVENSFKGLQSAMTKTVLNQGAPTGLARVSMLVGGIDQRDIQKFAKQPELLIAKLQEYAKKETNIGLRNETLKSFGISEGMVAALSRQAFRPDVLKKAPTYSDKEVGQLDKANIAWSNLGNKIQMLVGHFNAAHGGKLVTDISKIADQVFKLINAFTKLAEKLHVFEAIGKVFEGWTAIFGAVGDAVDQVTGAITEPKKREELIGNTVQGAKNVAGFLTSTDQTGYVKSLFKSVTQAFTPAALKTTHAVAPTMAKTAHPVNKHENNNVNITNNFQHPGVDPKKTGHSIKQSVEQSFRQRSAQARGTG